MSSFAERLLKQKMSNTGYGRTPPPAQQQPQQSSRQNRRSPQPPTSSTPPVPPGEPPSDESIDLTPDGLIVRRRRPRNTRASMGDLNIDLDIHAPVTNRS